MDKKNFIETLRRALYGKTDHTSLEEHIRYYETYIDQEMSKGRTEKEVLDELGDPRLIARTILETSGRRSSYMEYTVRKVRAMIRNRRFGCIVSTDGKLH